MVAWSKERPITAAACATSLTGCSRSSRAINESCRLAGIARPLNGPPRWYASAVSSSAPDSNTALVISSTNSGTPSLRTAISSSTASGSRFPSLIRSTMSCTAARASRFKTRRVTTGWLAKAAPNVGRAVTTTSTALPCTRSSASSSISRVVGSIQCASSTTHITGRRPADPISWSTRAAKVRARRCCGVSVSAPYRSVASRSSSAARSAVASGVAVGPSVRVSHASSLPSRRSGSSSGSMSAA